MPVDFNIVTCESSELVLPFPVTGTGTIITVGDVKVNELFKIDPANALCVPDADSVASLT